MFIKTISYICIYMHVYCAYKYMHMCVYMHMYACVFVFIVSISIYMCVLCLGRPEVDIWCLSYFLLRPGFLLNLQPTDSARLTDQKTPGTLLSLLPHSLGLHAWVATLDILNVSPGCLEIMSLCLHSKNFTN